MERDSSDSRSAERPYFARRITHLFPAIRQNGLARWLAVVLALFGLAAILLLGVAQSIGATRGRVTAAPVLPGIHLAADAQLSSSVTEPASARREPARGDGIAAPRPR